MVKSNLPYSECIVITMEPYSVYKGNDKYFFIFLSFHWRKRFGLLINLNYIEKYLSAL